MYFNSVSLLERQVVIWGNCCPLSDGFLPIALCTDNIENVPQVAVCLLRYCSHKNESRESLGILDGHARPALSLLAVRQRFRGERGGEGTRGE